MVNNLFIQGLERRWLKPAPPGLERDAVPRTAEMRAVREALAARESVAITGQVAKAQTLTVQGAPGVGKTTLAHLLALQLAEGERYRDGVIWLELGPDFQRPDQAQAVLRTWAGYATNFFGLPANLNQRFIFEPEAVRSLLAEHPHLLVVLDDVWSLAAIQPLRVALSAGAHLIITTRLHDLATNLGGGRVEVGLLSREEALALVELRLGWQPAAGADGDGWAGDLMNAVGFRPLGLDVALGVLLRYGDGAADWEKTARRLIAAVQSGDVERLHLGDDDPGHNVKAVIRFSYDALPDDETRRRLRTLAAFASEAEFSTALAAAAWGCDEESAYETLTGFANAALLDRLGGDVWRQHGLLRAFGAALLRDAGEQERAAHAHARAYGDAMRAADDEQRYYQMRPALPQLSHAFDWAAANDLDLALDIAENCANLHVQFGLARQAGEWSERLLAAAQAGRADKRTLGRALGHRANRLSDLASLPGEDRGGRLRQALAAYDEALALRRDVPLDYATTQNNRANAAE
ncbi:MAG: NB-ARC domain-containing protein [Anaerolineae bacterium]